MDPLKFLEIEDPRKHQARFSQLSGQKANLMPKMTPGKKSVGAAAVQGAIGGAIAGGQMAATMGAFDTPPGLSGAGAPGAEAYGDRTAPTIEPGPSQPGQSGSDYDSMFGGKTSGDILSRYF